MKTDEDAIATRDKGRVSLIGSVTTPLGFFVLALLIVESFLGAAIVGGKLDATLQATCVWAGVGMFVLVVLIVFSLVWSRPNHLLYDTETIRGTKFR